MKLKVAKGTDKKTRAVVEITKKQKSGIGGGGKGRMSMGAPMSIPECPAAWTAFWAWFAMNRAYCAIIGFFGPWAALGCAAAMAVAGAVMDFNRAC